MTSWSLNAHNCDERRKSYALVWYLRLGPDSHGITATGSFRRSIFNRLLQKEADYH